MSELMLTPVFSVSEQRVIRRAMRLLEKYQRNPGESFLSSDATKNLAATASGTTGAGNVCCALPR